MAHDTSPRRAARRVSLSQRRALVTRTTRLQPLRDIPSIRLHLAADAEAVTRATAAALGVDEAPLPYWAFAWSGGLAIARYLAEHPEEMTSRTVLDLATGSGLCAIAAMQAGAATVTGVDIDPFAEAAVDLNAKANGVRVGYIGRDLLDDEPPDVDVILAGDTSYEGPFAERVGPWLRRAAARGTRVLVGDPGRRYLPTTDLVEVAAYEVHTTTAFEDRDVVTARAFTLPARSTSPPVQAPESSER